MCGEMVANMFKIAQCLKYCATHPTVINGSSLFVNDSLLCGDAGMTGFFFHLEWISSFRAMLLPVFSLQK